MLEPPLEIFFCILMEYQGFFFKSLSFEQEILKVRKYRKINENAGTNIKILISYTPLVSKVCFHSKLFLFNSVPQFDIKLPSINA